MIKTALEPLGPWYLAEQYHQARRRMHAFAPTVRRSISRGGCETLADHDATRAN